MKKFPKQMKAIVIIIILIFGSFFAYNLYQFIFLWKMPLFSSTDYAGILKKAIDSKNPEKCNRLASNLGDNDPRSDCYINTVVAIGDISLCQKYFSGGVYTGSTSVVDNCRTRIAASKADISFCDGVDLNKYNACVYVVASRSRNGLICSSLKDGTNFTKAKCLYEIITGNFRDINSGKSGAFSEKDAKDICSMIEESQLRDGCFANVIKRTNDKSLCAEISNVSNITDSSTEALCSK